ncbi:MAG: glycosyltransferase family 4 protein [Syntrophobacteraceae bacterium]
MEKRAYRYADVVTVHSAGNKEFLLRSRKVSSGKLVMLHNWIGTGENGFETCETPFRRQLGLQDKFIFLFGGVMGPSQGLELVIEAASRLKGEKALAFLLVGDGAEKENLQRRARNHALKNVLFHPFVSRPEYCSLLNEIDVGLVCLTSKNKTPVVPGKILAYMASSIPVLALLNRESDGHRIIQEAGCGYSARWSTPDTAARLMLRMYRERGLLKESGARGRDFAAAHFSKKACVDLVERLIQP